MPAPALADPVSADPAFADTVFKAIAHPTRRRILSLLTVSSRSVKELTTEFSMSQPAISQHLKELRDANLVASDRVGLEQRYRLTPAPLRYVVDWSSQYRSLIDPAGHAWAFLQQAKAAIPQQSNPVQSNLEEKL